MFFRAAAHEACWSLKSSEQDRTATQASHAVTHTKSACPGDSSRPPSGRRAARARPPNKVARRSLGGRREFCEEVFFRVGQIAPSLGDRNVHVPAWLLHMTDSYLSFCPDHPERGKTESIFRAQWIPGPHWRSPYGPMGSPLFAAPSPPTREPRPNTRAPCHPWSPMGSPMGHHGAPGGPVGSHRAPGCHGVPWVPTGPRGAPRGPVGPHGAPWGPVGPHGPLWGPMGGAPWAPTGRPHGDP